MKKTVVSLLLALVMVLAMCQTAAAAGLEITNVIPGDGETGKQITNMAVKFTFSDAMGESSAEDNNGKFEIADAEGNKIGYTIVCAQDKYPNQLWLILDDGLLSNTEYTVTAKAGVVSAGGSTLENDYSIGFRTRNTKTDQTISMLMMAAFMVVMFGVTKKATQDAANNDDVKAQAKTETTDVYKYAKEKGISVDEANKRLNAGKERMEKKLSKAQEKKAERDAERAAAVAEAEKRIEAEMEAARKALNYRVHGPKSLKEAGGRVPRSVIRKNKARRAAREKARK